MSMNAAQASAILAPSLHDFDAFVARLEPRARSKFRWFRPAIERELAPLTTPRAGDKALRRATRGTFSIWIRMVGDLAPLAGGIQHEIADSLKQTLSANSPAAKFLGPLGHYDYQWARAAFVELIQALPATAVAASLESMSTPADEDLDTLENDLLAQSVTLLIAVDVLVSQERNKARARAMASLAADKMRELVSSPPLAGFRVAPHLHGTEEERATWHRLLLRAIGPMPEAVDEPLGG